MAEQCIVCLDPLLHSEDPPPPTPDKGNTPPNTTEVNASAVETATAPNAEGADNDDRADAAAAGLHTAHDTGSVNHDDDNVAVIQICGHMLHDTCLREWSGKANSCPICRQTFHSVSVYNKIGGTLLSSYKVEDKKQVAEFDPQAWLDEYAEAEDEDVSTPCPVCNLADNEEVLLLCDGCDTPYHTHCIGLETVPHGAWFCMECVDLFGQAVQAPAAENHPFSVAARRSGGGIGRSRNDFFPRTRQSMRRARRRARSDEWQGAWGQITGRIWDVLNIDLDHDEDDALEEYRRVERLRNNERREFERWQERLDIARRLGAQEVFERNIPTAILHRSGNRQPDTIATGSSALRTPQPQLVTPRESREERRAWGAFERALDCDPNAAPPSSSSGGRKRKTRSTTASPVEPAGSSSSSSGAVVQEPERKLKRPRTRRITALPSGDHASSSSAGPSNSASGTGSSIAATATEATAATTTTATATATAATASTENDASNVGSENANSSVGTDEPRSFLSSLLKEVEMSTPSDDENIRCLFGEPRTMPAVVDASSPAGSSPAASTHNSPRAMSTTPPPLAQQQRTLRPSSPTLLSSHIEPIYPPANYSPTRVAASSPTSDHSDSESSSTKKMSHRFANSQNSNSHPQQQRHYPHNNQHHNNHGLPSSPSSTVVEIRQPRPRRQPAVALPRTSPDVSPTRSPLSLEMKESISSIVRTALKPHWKSSQLTADQYAAINRDVSHKLYEEVTDPATAAADAEARKAWERRATREVERAVAGLHA